MPASRVNLVLGLAVVALCLLALGVWIPLDTETGIIETARRHTVIGDALAPVMAAVLTLLGGAMLVLFERHADQQPHPSAATLAFALRLVAVIALSLLVMRYAGPLAASVAGDTEYRLLRDTPGWKHIGFLLGGTLMVAGCMAVVTGRLTGRAVLIGLITALVLIAIYDLPFDDLLLPPNGDF